MLGLIESSVGKSEEERNAAFKALSDEISALRSQQETNGSAQASAENRRSRMNEIIAVLEGHDFCLEEYDDGLVRQMVERVRILGVGKIAVKFELGPEYVCELRDGSTN
jgi:hypothetical protein